MTELPSASSHLAYTLAMTNDAMTAVVRGPLADRGIAAEKWGALQLIATRGPVLARGTLIDQLERSRALSAEAARELLAGLADEGLIHGTDEVQLSAAGRALYDSLSDRISVARNRVLRDISTTDLDTTLRTLAAIKETAAALTGIAQPAQ